MHLTYHYFYKKQFFSRVKLKELYIAQNNGSFNINQHQDFTFLYFMLVIPVTIIGSIFSGGFVDVFGYRYFSFPIALCLILWILVLDKESFFDGYFYALICIYILLLTIAFFSIKDFLSESGKKNLYQLYKTGLYTEQEKTAECLNYLSSKGFNLRGGVASFWNARGVSYKTRKNVFILPILNDAMPYFWMSTLGPLKHPQNYGSFYYNFSILNKANIQDTFNFNTSTIGVLLPKPSEKIDCGDREIWIYKDQSLDEFIREKIKKFLLVEAGKKKY
jgi:hypothetical protein